MKNREIWPRPHAQTPLPIVSEFCTFYFVADNYTYIQNVLSIPSLMTFPMCEVVHRSLYSAIFFVFLSQVVVYSQSTIGPTSKDAFLRRNVPFWC